MLGVATYTIVVSSMIMKKPRQTMSSAGHGLRRGWGNSGPPVVAYENNEDGAAISTGSTRANVFCREDHRTGGVSCAKCKRRNRLMPSALKAERSHMANAGSAESSMISGSII